MIGFLSLLFSPRAEAFCGTFIGGADATLYNEIAQVAIVRSGTQNILTLANDVQGNFDSFALVLPVPEVLAEDDIHVLEPALFDRLDQYTQPRLVQYTCEDFYYPPQAGAGGGTDYNESADPNGGVTVEAQYVVGEYEVVILSATQSEGLFIWLNDNGYAVPGQSMPLLEEYIDGGSLFLAAKVDASASIADGDMLSPLQLKYDSSVFQIPIRIGTLNSKSEQDLIVYAVNDYQEGAVGISNYPEFTIEDECMWESQGEEFGQYYTEKFREGYESMNDGAWTTEYAWGGGGCDPCTGNPPDGNDLISLGVQEDRIHTSDYFFTRLHMRYTPQQADEEVMLYHSNISTQQQIRFIEYKYELEEALPVCGIGMVDDPGTCDDIYGNPSSEPSAEPSLEPSEPAQEETEEQTNTTKESGCSGCSTGGEPLLFWWMLSILGLRRTRQK